ncbi:MAG: baseplate J/gp47 family protein [Streptococcaceae bacterium]|jgi:uncharacterized phage protein gp47/JayE|nr:baseplate J/gp47 family protein [Streptococcaceae bacterium]
MSIADFQEYTYEYYLEKALARVPAGIDTREGSIIYDAIAPVAYSFAEEAMMMQQVQLNAYIQTATGEFLDYKAEEQGTRRIAATFAKVIAYFTDDSGNPLTVDIGDRFSSTGNNPIFYSVSKILENGQAEMTAEIAGVAPNKILGQLLPITPFNHLGTAEILNISVPARDVESDDDLRVRLLNAFKTISFGGNVADYIDKVKEIDEIGAVQVYPTWDGGGTVRLFVLDNAFNAANPQIVDIAQQAIDPTDAQGDGRGLAPIGHTVTVSPPTNKPIDVSMTVITDDFTTVTDVTPAVNAAIDDYLLSLRKMWGNLVNARQYKCIAYRSQLLVEILKVQGVVSVSDVEFNNLADDITMTLTGQLSELPVKGSVVVNG